MGPGSVLALSGPAANSPFHQLKQLPPPVTTVLMSSCGSTRRLNSKRSSLIPPPSKDNQVESQDSHVEVVVVSCEQLLKSSQGRHPDYTVFQPSYTVRTLPASNAQQFARDLGIGPDLASHSPTRHSISTRRTPEPIEQSYAELWKSVVVASR
ncbi:hypothetical protein FIBSPDRAFT_966917 [Athelia psychrophila]|uniref:Uncharacterized protein n=1 Tax=Athelia psychrophila TaxID=1759441 RepID=A0A167WAK4_9AGAM|nr:hypothetical protein FIBSPDRAFT_966917 [Fibularhizoctonia sp. CBS 109695]